MEITISKQILSSALGRTSFIADKKSSMQILSNVLITTEGPKQIRISSTDLNISASGVFPGTVLDGGSVTLPAKTFYDIVRNLPEGEVSLKSEGENVDIACGRAKFKLLGLPPEDFPRLPEADAVEFFEIDAYSVASMIEKTAFSICNDETRPHINGALFQGDGKTVRMVTTDGHRLTKAEIKFEEAGFYNFSMVVPNKAINEIRRLLEDSDEMILIGSHDGSIFLKSELEVEKATDGAPAQKADVMLVAKLIESDFPPYDQVIPSAQDKSVIISRTEFLEALKRVSIVSTDKTLGVKFSFEEGVMNIAVDNPAVGEGNESVDIGYEYDALSIGFNARYFIDILNVLNCDDITLELAGELDPAVVLNDEKNFVGVVMPMRI